LDGARGRLDDPTPPATLLPCQLYLFWKPEEVSPSDPPLFLPSCVYTFQMLPLSRSSVKLVLSALLMFVRDCKLPLRIRIVRVSTTPNFLSSQVPTRSGQTTLSVISLSSYSAPRVLQSNSRTPGFFAPFSCFSRRSFFTRFRPSEWGQRSSLLSSPFSELPVFTPCRFLRLLI